MADFIVIGGGIAGVSAAAQLSKLGTVTVLEMEDALGYHASGRSAALFEPNYGNTSTVALSRASADHFCHANGGYLTPRGLMLLATADQTKQFATDLKELDLQEISLDDAINRVPILNHKTVAAAAFHDIALDIDTDRLIQDFARMIRANGGTTQTKTVVTSITSTDDGWQVSAGEKTYQAKVLINAAGAWVDQIAELAGVAPIGIQPLRRSMAQLPAPDGHDVSSWPMMLGAGEGWYAKPEAGKLLVSPADTDLMTPHDAFADDMVLAEGLARYEEMVSAPVTRVENNWAGLRSFSPDKALVLGPDPTVSNFFWCAAQGGFGFQTAPAAGRLLADLVAGRKPELDTGVLAQLSPERFH
ncbi:FAD-binding oxidoreductase [Parasedimentitalea maritima]|uniref:FAD-binding oxidoreductase n=1 Tax=Parasedimentitalea maritima TaxID=2578117 RepID=A0ABY2UU21_9RHOB|nr:FAD-binding oxidoreductase [Zongyanglinia marina]TLP62799.1 FAD-binding oxidoreductase [Zongyanglinia marina]